MNKMAKKDESFISRLKAIRHALDLLQKEFARHINKNIRYTVVKNQEW